MPKVSVIIPVYNVEKYLKQCIDSVINQTLKDIEIICIDDGSTDNSSILCEDYALIDSRIKVIHQTNKGLGGARNTGLRYATGEYILFLDSDDWIERSACEIMLNKAIEIDADIVLSGETLYFENTNTYKPGWRNFKNYTGIKEINKLNFIETFTPAWARLYRKSFIEKYNLKFVEHCYYEDNSWGCLIAIFAQQIGFVENQFFYRQRDGAITSKKDEKVFDWIEDFRYFNNFIKEKSINSEKLEMVKVWYFLNFYNYYQQLSYKNKKIFRNKIRKILPLLNIDINFIKNTEVIKNKNEKKQLIKFFKFLNSNLLYEYLYTYKNIIQNIFSVKNQNLYKVITILGIKIKFLRKNKIKKQFLVIQKELYAAKQNNKLLDEKIYNFAEFISHYNKEPIKIDKHDYQNNEIYDKDFYASQAKESYHSAQIVINILKKYYNPKSILDLGCGVGTWLKAWQDSGVEEILGVDANEIPENVLYIPRKNLKIFDFENTREIIDFGQFDMAMSLECFEHIASEKCGYALDILTNASNLIMFSAAIPYQSGTNHINCRHLQYWVEQFKKRGYACYDIIRPECIRQNLSIASWYEQNILIFAKGEKANILEENGAIAVANPVMFYHNEILKSILYSFNESQV